MGLFNLFKKKDKTKVKKEVQEVIEDNRICCESCKLPIEQWDKVKTFEKKKYHVKCMRKLRKQAMKMYTGQI